MIASRKGTLFLLEAWRWTGTAAGVIGTKAEPKERSRNKKREWDPGYEMGVGVLHSGEDKGKMIVSRLSLFWYYGLAWVWHWTGSGCREAILRWPDIKVATEWSHSWEHYGGWPRWPVVFHWKMRRHFRAERELKTLSSSSSNLTFHYVFCLSAVFTPNHQLSSDGLALRANWKITNETKRMKEMLKKKIILHAADNLARGRARASRLVIYDQRLFVRVMPHFITPIDCTHSILFLHKKIWNEMKKKKTFCFCSRPAQELVCLFYWTQVSSFIWKFVLVVHREISYFLASLADT